MHVAAGAAALLLMPAPRITAPSMNQQLVVYEANDFLVVNKPPGVVVHDGENSLMNALAALGHSNMDPCHRLDAATSGVLLCARKGATGRLQKCLATTDTIKRYRGIVRGSFKGSGVWTQSISTKAEGRKNPRGVAASRVNAATEYRVLEHTQDMAAVDFVLRSGRTHQIRKHAACNRHQILGDSRYGDPKHAADTKARYGFDGMALHSALLAITIDGTDHVFEAPLPPSWDGLLEEFANGLPAPSDPAVAVSSSTGARRRLGAPQAPQDAALETRGGEARHGTHTGTVASWNAAKGYGFIRREDGQDNVYVSQRRVLTEGFRSLREGETVAFDVGQMEDGKLEALHVTGPGGQPVLGQPAGSRRQSAKGASGGGASARTVDQSSRGHGKGKKRPPATKLTADDKERVRKPLPPGAFPAKKKA